jgi:hypothetical protein
VELLSRHKAYVVVLGLASLALSVDRLLLSGEATSPSKASATVPSPPSPSTPAAVPGRALPTIKSTLAARLHALKPEGGVEAPNEVGNAFVPEWETGLAPNPTTNDSPVLRGAGDWLRLTSVIPGRAAVLNGTIVFVGKEQAVPAEADSRLTRTGRSGSNDDRRTVLLVRAEERSVVVRVGDQEVELSLAGRGEPPRSRAADDRP